MGVLLVGLLLTCMPVMAEVNSQSTMALSMSVKAPDEARTNALNEVEITLENTANYPVKARTIVKPSYFELKPRWFEGVDVMEIGNGVTFTTEVPASDSKTVDVTIPGRVLEGLNTEDDTIKLMEEVKAYPFTSTSAQAHGVGAHNLQTVSVEGPESQFIETTVNVFTAVLLLVVGAGLVILGSKTK